MNLHRCTPNPLPSFAGVPPSFVIGLLLRSLLTSYYITGGTLLEHRELYEHHHWDPFNDNLKCQEFYLMVAGYFYLYFHT